MSYGHSSKQEGSSTESKRRIDELSAQIEALKTLILKPKPSWFKRIFHGK